MTPEELAQLFHETYERLAPFYGYATRKESAVPWEQVPEPNKQLMIGVAAAVLRELRKREDAQEKQAAVDWLRSPEGQQTYGTLFNSLVEKARQLRDG